MNSHVRAFEYFGGVVGVLVPDNLKSGVTKACRYEPVLNRSYKELARSCVTAHDAVDSLPTGAALGILPHFQHPSAGPQGKKSSAVYCGWDPYRSPSRVSCGIQEPFEGRSRSPT